MKRFRFRRDKRYHFRQDAPKVSLWSRFHLTNQQKRSILHWGLYGVVMLVLSVLQDVLFCRIRVFGAAPDPVPCLIMVVCLLEGVESGGVFALIASFLYLFSGTAPGVYACTLITTLSILAAAFRQTYLQKGFRTAVVCCVPAMAVYELLIFAIGLFLRRTVVSRLPGFLLTAGLSCLFLPLIYPVTVAVSKVGGATWKE